MPDAAMQRCPKCGYEYLPGIKMCGNCLVPLEASVSRGNDPSGDMEVCYDLADWTREQRAVLQRLLDSQAIAATWNGTELVVAEDAERRVDALIDYLESPDNTLPENVYRAAALLDGVLAERLYRRGQPASPIARLLGAIADAVVIVILPLPILALARNASFTTQLAIQLATAAYAIVPTALFGRTLGKFSARTRVVRMGTDDPPGWWPATARYMTGALGPVIATAFPRTAGVWLAGIWPFIVYPRILLAADRRGLHDLVAGTQVVYAD